MLAARELSLIVQENKPIFVFLGVVLILAGLFAIAFPFLSSLAVEFVTGIALAAAAIALFIHAFGTPTWVSMALRLVLAVLYLVAGVVLIIHPLPGLLALTAFVAVIFVVDGIFRSVFAFQLRPSQGWGWMLAGGLAGIVLGVLLGINFPFDAAWALGLLAGLNLVFYGVTVLMMAFGGTEPEDWEGVAV